MSRARGMMTGQPAANPRPPDNRHQTSRTSGGFRWTRWWIEIVVGLVALVAVVVVVAISSQPTVDPTMYNNCRHYIGKSLPDDTKGYAYPTGKVVDFSGVVGYQKYGERSVYIVRESTDPSSPSFTLYVTEELEGSLGRGSSADHPALSFSGEVTGYKGCSAFMDSAQAIALKVVALDRHDISNVRRSFSFY